MAEGVHGVGIRTFVYFLDWLKKEWVSNISDFMERAGLGVVVALLVADRREPALRDTPRLARPIDVGHERLELLAVRGRHDDDGSPGGHGERSYSAQEPSPQGKRERAGIPERTATVAAEATGHLSGAPSSRARSG